MSKRKAYAKAKRESGGFIALPHAVLRSEKYGNLSAIATKLINDLFAQFNGKNNGDLCCAWTILNKRGWVSRDTLNRARIELLEKQFIEVSRQGGRNTPTLYALTFYSVDDCGGKLDIQPTGRSQTHTVAKMDGDIVKQQPFGPGHHHLPANIFGRGFKGNPFSCLVA